MLVPVREYQSVAEMIGALMAIRSGFLGYVPAPAKPIVGPVSKPKVTLPPIPAKDVLFIMHPDMAYPLPRRVGTGLHEVLRTVCSVWGISMIDLISERRTKNLMMPRQSAYALACHLTTCSLPAIGRAMGGRDHTTILHGKNKLAPLIEAVATRHSPDADIRTWAVKLRAEQIVCDSARRESQLAARR